MSNDQLIDHLFRHQYGKMVSILTRIFGLHHLETIEDAVQDTFSTAMLKWRQNIPENPEAWLTKAAKNRAIDLLRKIKAEKIRFEKLDTGQSVIAIEQMFLNDQVEDSQLRMVFTACHPALHPKDQIAFALKTIAGFSTDEIATSLLLKNETVKKRLTRARKNIREKDISFQIPEKKELIARMARVHEVLYLIFIEGFHSNHSEMLIRKDLCGEAMRLMKMILKKENLRNGAGYALFALMCFHASRLESKVSENFESIDLKNQDRSKWYVPLMELGGDALLKAREYPDRSSYHLEAKIALEHLKAPSFESTDWERILKLYDQLYELQKDKMTALNIAMIKIQLQQNKEAKQLLDQIHPEDLEQRAYLYYGVMAEYHQNLGKKQEAIKYLNEALKTVTNEAEANYLKRKLEGMKLG